METTKLIQKRYNIPLNGKKRVLIIGAGFAGLKLAKELTNSKFQVVLLDKQNFHQFQPLYYQVATSGLEPSSISFPVRKMFHKNKNIHFRTTEVKRVNTTNKTVTTEQGDIKYDYLVIATGVYTNYFGMKDIEEHGISMKTTSEAIRLRNILLQNFESAVLEDDKEKSSAKLSIIVVGGGPTGVELSGAIAEMRNYVLHKDYPEIDFGKMKVYLCEASGRVLSAMEQKSSDKALNYLKDLGVEVLINTRVESYDGKEAKLSDGSTIKSETLLWTAGVSGVKIDGLTKDAYTFGSRLNVDRLNKVLREDFVFAIGDNCYMETPNYPKGHPQVAQVAIQQAKNLGKNLKKNLSSVKEFEYKDKGSMATIGRNMAVVDLPGLRFTGFIAWILWLFVHLMAIVGVKNRLFIFINWAWSYISRDQSLRIMIKHKS